MLNCSRIGLSSYAVALLGSLSCAFVFLGCKLPLYNTVSGINSSKLGDPMTVGGGSASQGANLPTWPLSAARCRRNADDRLEMGGTLLFGPYATANAETSPCIAKSQIRPVLVLANSDAEKFGLKTDLKRIDYGTQVRPMLLNEQFANIKYLSIANVEDIDDQLMVAQIPVGNIKDVYFHIEKFYIGNFVGAHGQMRVIFNEPVVFRKQYPASATSPVMLANDIILSVNAAPPVGVSFDAVVKGRNDSYAATWGVLTTRERYRDSYLRQQNPTEQWRLRLTQDQAKKVVMSYFAWSEWFEYRRVYNTTLQSCGTEQFYNLDSALGQEIGQPFPAEINPYKPAPSSIPSYRYQAGAWDPPQLLSISNGDMQMLSKLVGQGFSGAVADALPLFAADGLGVPGPLRKRHLIAPGNVDKAPDFSEDPSLKPIQAQLCAMANEYSNAFDSSPLTATDWQKVKETCNGNIVKRN